MTDNEQAIIENILNGNDPDVVAKAFDMSGEAVTSLFAFAQQIVREYQVTGGSTIYDCETIAQCRANKLQFMQALSQIRIWDEYEKPVVVSILQGRSWREIEANYPITKDQANTLLNNSLLKVSAHLKDARLAAFMKNRAAWVKTNLAEVVGIIDRFTSWSNGKQLKNITFSTIHQD